MTPALTDEAEVRLVIPPQARAITLVLRRRRFPAGWDAEAIRRAYEVDACPASYLREVEAVFLGDDEDPHGLARVARVLVLGTEPVRGALGPAKEEHDAERETEGG